MKVSSNKDSKHIAWAVGISFMLHLTTGAIYVLTPWIRALLAFSQMNKPSVTLDMGMPQFVDLMIEELKNSKPEDPPKVEEPQAPPEEPKKEDPPKVAVKPVDPDSIIEPIETPKSKPVSQPTSTPTSIAATQPDTQPTSIASTNPASKPSKAGGVPLVATGMVDLMPATSKWLVLLGTAQMRSSPEKEVLGYSMRNFVFSDGEPINKIGLDALDDVEEVMLSTPSPWVTKDRFAFILRLRDTQEKTKKKMEEAAAKAGTKLVSAKMNGHEIWQWESEAKLGATEHYAFAFLSQDVMVIGVPATLQQFFKPAATKPTSTPTTTKPTSEPVVEAPPKTLNRIMTERGQAPAILFAVSDLGKTFPLKQMYGSDWGESFKGIYQLPPQPLYFRAAFNTVENANASFEAAFLNNQDAINGATRVNALMNPLAAVLTFMKPYDLLVPIIKRVKFKVYGTKIRADIDISSEEVAILLRAFEPIIKGQAPPEDIEELEKDPKPPGGQSPLSPAKPTTLPSQPPSSMPY